MGLSHQGMPNLDKVKKLADPKIKTHMTPTQKAVNVRMGIVKKK